MDHRRAPIRDSLDARFTGIALPKVTLQGIGAQLDLGAGYSELQLARIGDGDIFARKCEKGFCQRNVDGVDGKRANLLIARRIEVAVVRRSSPGDVTESKGRSI